MNIAEQLFLAFDIYYLFIEWNKKNYSELYSYCHAWSLDMIFNVYVFLFLKVT